MVKIFCVMGTSELHFGRMKAALQSIKNRDIQVFIQSGYTSVEELDMPFKKFLSRQEMKVYYDWSDILLIQGGVGTITEALKLTKEIIIIPRLESAKEIIGDQFQFAELVAINRPNVKVIYTPELLRYILQDNFKWTEEEHYNNVVDFVNERINK
jgi:UDP-N-acetylglucosamine transferase subunit ALG13